MSHETSAFEQQRRADGIVPKSNAARRNELRMRGIHVFDTYAGAAADID